MFKRYLSHKIKEAAQDTPVVLLNGARQSGKSTLVRELFSETHTHWTLDDPSFLSLIKNDPMRFLSEMQGPLIIDEVQRFPEIFLPIKMKVDQIRIPGQFILTGSANVLALPKMADSLAGRMEVHTLWPLAQAEIREASQCFIDSIFETKIPDFKQGKDKGAFETLLQAILVGGYPSSVLKQNDRRRDEWFHSYLTTLVEKDIRDLSNIEALTEIPNFLNVLAARVGGLLNTAEISRSLSLSTTTLRRYLTLLEKVYIVELLPAWTKNLSKRAIKSPKIYLNDTGILCHLRGQDAEALRKQSHQLGHIIENFVVVEMMKLLTWSEERARLYHYLSQGGQEVDLILENYDSRIVAIEIKSSTTVNPASFKGIEHFAQEASGSFFRGIILYGGDKVIPYKTNMYAVPISALWA
jgi:hypothetical protein